jgi:hypothetical protein
MRRQLATILTFSVLLVGGMSTAARAGVDININLGHPPPPPVFFEREPRVVLVPRTHVYYVPNLEYDFFRHGDYWYMNKGGYWYRARSYRGPFEAVVYERVPREIIVLPPNYHHHPMHPHGGPPGQLKKHGEEHPGHPGHGKHGH